MITASIVFYILTFFLGVMFFFQEITNVPEPWSILLKGIQKSGTAFVFLYSFTSGECSDIKAGTSV